MATGAASSGASSSAIEAGRAFVRLMTEDSMLVRGLSRAKAMVGKFGNFMSGIGAKAGVAGGLLLAPLIALTAGGAARAGEMDDMADAFGTTTEALSPMAHAFSVAGLELDDMGKAMSAVGGDVAELQAVLEKLNDIEDPGEKIKAFEDTFGKKMGRKMAALAADLPDLMKDAPILDSQSAKDAEKTSFAIKRAMLAIQAAMLPVLSILTPIIDGISKFAAKNADVLQIVAAVAAGLIGLSVAASVVGFAFSGVAAVMGLVGGIIGALLTPIVAVVALVGGLGYVLATETETGKEMTSSLKAGFMETADTAKKAFGGIAAALKKGDIEGAMKIVGAALRFEWAKIDAYWTTSWAQFKRYFKDGWDDLGADISIVWNDITTGIETALADALKAILDSFNSAIKSIADGAASLLEEVGLDDTARDLRNVKGIGANWIDKWKGDIAANDAAEMKRILAAQDKAKAENEKDFNDQVRPVNDAVNAAKAEFEKLVADMMQKEEKPPTGAGGRKDDLEMAFASAKGLFSSPNFAQSLGIADNIQEKQLKVQEQIRDGVDRLQPLRAQ